MSEQNVLLHRPGVAKNANPVFKAEEGKKTLPFNEKLMKAADGLTRRFDFIMHVAFARQQGKRHRMPPPSRLKAIEALLQGMCFHYDPLANRVNVATTNLAIQCGLATETTHETHTNVAISRATRALKSLDDLGLITYKTEFCAALGCYFPSDITFLPAFFKAIDISDRAIEGARRSRAAHKNKLRADRGLPALSLDEMASESGGAMRKRFYEYRLKRKQQGEKRAKALRDSERSRIEIENLVRREITKEIAKGLFPTDADMAYTEIARRVKERMIMSRGNFTRIAA